MAALLLFHLAGAVLVAGFRFGDDVDLAVGLGPRSWPMLAAVTVGLAALAVRRQVMAGRAPWSSFDRAALWTLAGVGPVVLWAVGDRQALRGVDTFVFGAMAAVGVALLVRHRVRWTRSRPWFGAGGKAGRWLLLGTLVAGAGVGLVILAGPGPEPPTTIGGWVLALSTYPLYALVQLGAALALPAFVWRRDAASPRAIVVACAVLFALIHAPNPLVMGLTGLGMLAWAAAYLRGVGLVWIALSMGLLGALVAQGLPEPTTQNMRVNAGYVLALRTDRHVEAYDARVDRLASDAFHERHGGRLRPWLAAVAREVTGREPAAAVLDDWERRIRHANRDRILRMFLESGEFRRRHGIGRIFEGRDRSLLFSTFEPWHPAHAVYDSLRARDPAAPVDESFEDFLRRVYGAVLGREASIEELEGWSSRLPYRARVEVVRVVLARAGIEDPAPWRRPESWPRWAVP
jgi:hypothetical protein